jgi:murein DD-endopeptidase MepM/ murein hydrolase activator NlpD
MQDALAARLLNHSGMEALNRQTVQALQKGNGTAAGDSPEALRAVAKEFESLFLNHMLSVMRQTIDDSGLTEKGPGEGIYTELFDQEVARSLAGRGALGISDLLVRKLSDQVAPAESEAGQGVVSKQPAPREPGAQAGEAEEVPDFRMPVQARVSSTYGVRKDPFTHEMRMHRGVDIAAPAGMEVHAACAGVVVSSGYEKGYGNTVVVQHPGGFETRYAHLNTLKVNVGDQVQASGVLGTVGSTGHSTGPHLHFEVIRNGNQMDPEALLPH